MSASQPQLTYFLRRLRLFEHLIFRLYSLFCQCAVYENLCIPSKIHFFCYENFNWAAEL